MDTAETRDILNDNPEKKFNPGFNYGLIAGLVITVISLLQYLGGLDMYLSPVGYVSYLVIITMAVLAALKVRKENEGFLEFSHALKVTFTVFAIALLIQTIFTYILFNFIDVSFKEAVSQEVMNKTEQMMKKFGASDSQIDAALEAERSKAVYIGANYVTERLNLSLNSFLKSIDNFVYRRPEPGQPVLTIAGAFPLITYRQTNALLYGLDAEGKVKLLDALEWKPEISILYAKDRDSKEWIIGMPPSRVTNSIDYSFKNGKRTNDSYAGLTFEYVSAQKRVPESIPDYKEAPPAYSLLHFNASTTLKTRFPLTLGLSIHNLLNETYRDYMNSMRYFSDETGRNITIRIKIDLKKQS